MMENPPINYREFISKPKLIETLKGFLEKPQEEILFSEIEATLEPFWENHPIQTPIPKTSDSEAMNKLAEFIKQYKEKNKEGRNENV